MDEYVEAVYQVLEKVPEHQRGAILERISHRIFHHDRAHAMELPKTPTHESNRTPYTPASSIHASSKGLWTNEHSPPIPTSVSGNLCDLNDHCVELTECGVSLRNVKIHIREDAPYVPLSRGTLQLQRYSTQHRGFLRVDYSRDSQKVLWELARDFEIPSMKNLTLNKIPGNPEDEFEQQLGALVIGDQPCEYLISMGHYDEIRHNLGLPATGLSPGTRLLRTRKHYPGIQSEYLYLSRARSVAAMHKEDQEANSKNVNYIGHEKLWLIISPSSSRRFEALIAEYFGVKPHCSQFVRHLDVIPFPSILREWQIIFRVICQRPGQAVEISSGAYHAVINTGPNIAGAINCAPDDWNPPPLSKDCTFKQCVKTEPIKCQDFQRTDEPKELDIDERWEIGPSRPISDEDVTQKTAFRRSKRRKSSKMRQRKDEVRGSPTDHERIILDEEDDTISPINQVNSMECRESADPVEDSLNIENEDDAGKKRNETQEGRVLDEPGPDTDCSVVGDDSSSDEPAGTLESEGIMTAHSSPLFNLESEEQTTPSSISEFSQRPKYGRKTPALTIIRQQPLVQDQEDGTDQSPDRDGFSPTSLEHEAQPVVDSNTEDTVVRLDQLGLKTPEDVIRDINQYMDRAQEDCSLQKIIFKDTQDWAETADNLLQLLPGRWINDRIVFAVLEYATKDRQDVQVIDSLLVSDAFRHENFEKLACKMDTNLIIFPCHVESHWFLTVCNTATEVLNIYDHAFLKSSSRCALQRFLITGFGHHVQKVEEKIVPQLGDGINCGIYVLALAETRLNDSQQLCLHDASALRSRYFNILLNAGISPEYTSLSGNFLAKKRPRSPEEYASEYACKRFHICAQIPPARDFDGQARMARKKLKAFGDEWIRFYEDSLSKQHSPGEIYWVLNLASIPACGSVMAQLVEALKDCSVNELITDHSMAIRLYTKGIVLSTQGQLLQRVSGTMIFEDFCERQAFHQKEKGEARKKRQKRGERKMRLPKSSSRNSSAFAMDDLLRKHMNVVLPPSGAARQGRFQTENNILRRAKMLGERANQVNSLLTTDSDELPSRNCLQYLLPLQKIPSQLDENVFVDFEDFLGIQTPQKDLLQHALRELRPELASVASSARVLHDMLCQNNVGIAVQNTSPQKLANQSLDSPVLLSVFSTHSKSVD